MNETILAAMQFAHMYDKDPINTAGSARETITYQYATTTAPADLPTSTVYTGWTPLTGAEISAFEAQLAHIETFLNVDFTEVTGSPDPDLNIGKVDIPGATTGYGGNSISFSGSTITRLDAYAVFDNAIDISQHSQINLILHEMGHALGLKHSFGSPALPAAEENNKYSVMSYSDNPDNGLSSDAMMLYDILALQDIWGAASYNTGNTSYTGKRTETVDTIWDTAGDDTLDASAKTTSVVLNLNEGAFSQFGAYEGVAIAYGTRIENAIGGTGGDRITGNQYANTLDGGGGRDTVKGGGRADTVAGGGGRDKVFGGGGRDTVLGSGGNDRLGGGLGHDKVYGGLGKDKVYGGGGRDRLDGGRGDDALTGNAGRDKFVFKLGSGSDTIEDFLDGTDSILIKNLGGLSGVLGTAASSGANVVFDFGGGDVLTVLNATAAQVSDDVMV